MSDLRFTKLFTLSHQYNIVNGFTFVLHDQMNNLALLSLIIRESGHSALEKRISTEQASLQLLLIDFNEQMYRLAGARAGKQKESGCSDGGAIFTLKEEATEKAF